MTPAEIYDELAHILEQEAERLERDVLDAENEEAAWLESRKATIT